MTGSPKRKIMIGVGVLALVLGVVVAIVTASGSSEGPIALGPHHRAALRDARGSSDLPVAAAYLGVSKAQLRHELRAGLTLADIANATSGRSAPGLTKALFAARAAHLSSAVSTGALSKAEQASHLAKLPGRLAAEIYRRHTTQAGSLDIATATGYLGLTVKRVREDLRGGHSLAQIAAGTPGKSAAGLVHALVSAKSAALAAAVRTGTLSRAEQRTMSTELVRVARAEVDRVPAKRAARGS